MSLPNSTRFCGRGDGRPSTGRLNGLAGWSMLATFHQSLRGWDWQDIRTFCVPCAPHPSHLIPLYPLPLCPMATFRTSLHPSQPPEPLSTFSHPFITSSSPHTPLCSQPGYCLWPLPLGTWGCKATKPRSRFWR